MDDIENIKLKPSDYWTFERCLEVALKCESRSEFHDRFISAYNKGRKSGWGEELCSHMKPMGNLRKRLVYSYEFSNNYAYVGITCNEKKRDRDHRNGVSPIHDHIDKYNLIPTKKILSDGYVEVSIAQHLENYWWNEYIKNGWNILNKKKTGGLGGNIITWNKENCSVVALECESRKEFSIKYSSAYISSRKNKWLDEICSHMIPKRKPTGYWTYNTCKEAALLHKTRFDYSHKCSHAYLTSTKNNWLDEFYPIAKI